MALTETTRRKLWGWFIVVLLVSPIGAMLYGFLGAQPQIHPPRRSARVNPGRLISVAGRSKMVVTSTRDTTVTPPGQYTSSARVCVNDTASHQMVCRMALCSRDSSWLGGKTNDNAMVRRSMSA